MLKDGATKSVRNRALINQLLVLGKTFEGVYQRIGPEAVSKRARPLSIIGPRNEFVEVASTTLQEQADIQHISVGL